MLTSSRDNWERLVVAVVKRQQIRELCHQQSISTITSDDDFSERNLSFSSTSLAPSSVPPSPFLPPKNLPSVWKSSSSSFSRPITRKLFSAWYRRRPQDHYFDVLDECDPEVYLGQLKKYSFRELQVATDNFDNKNILGKGSFGKVYKGRLADGTLVAIKRRKEERTIGGELQFQTEVEMNSMAVHRNLLRLRGFCMTPTERLLVYPFMVNGSVASCLRGHIAPEYLYTGKLSEKADVYGYGVTLVELISAKKAFDLARLADEDFMLLDWVKGLLKEKKLETIVDPELQNNYVDEDVEQLIQVALLCTQSSPSERPKMSEVVRMLEGDEGI